MLSTRAKLFSCFSQAPKETRIFNNPKAHLAHEVTPKFEETNKTKAKVENMKLKFEYMLAEAKMNTIYIYTKST